LRAAAAQIEILSFCADFREENKAFLHMQMALKNPSGEAAKIENLLWERARS